MTSLVQRVTVESKGGSRRHLVLRRWVDDHDGSGPDRVRREAEILSGLAATAVPAPALVAADETGAAAGCPALLMSRVPGHIELQPRDPSSWLEQLASMLPVIHSAPVEADPWFQWIRDPEVLVVPEWSSWPGSWQAAIDTWHAGPPDDGVESFVHRDYQHFNVLWRGDRLTGIVDWVYACRGAPDIDVAHCRLNLAILYSPERAAEFLARYEAVAGRRVDARWDVSGILAYLPSWAPYGFLQRQAGRRAVVDTAGMNARVDTLMHAAAARL